MEKRPESTIAAPVVKIVKLSLWDMNCYHLPEKPETNTDVGPMVSTLFCKYGTAKNLTTSRQPEKAKL
jgi:hypothetical protein